LLLAVLVVVAQTQVVQVVAVVLVECSQRRSR
jgi:hypothetical protein